MRPAHKEYIEPGTRLLLSCPAEPSVLAPIRRHLREWLSSCGIDERRTCDIVLAVSEACSNCVEHAYTEGTGTIALAGDTSSHHLRLAVTDHGRWKSFHEEDHGLRGRGLDIIRSLVPDTTIATSPAGTRVELRIPRDPEEKPLSRSQRQPADGPTG